MPAKVEEEGVPNLSFKNTSQNMSFGDLELHGHSHIFFSLVYMEVFLKRVQQPITNFTDSWDDFMVHGLHNPLEAKVEQLQESTA